MKLTKEDYMRLKKERLAELLVEIQEHPIEPERITLPTMPTTPFGIRGGCDGTICTNPHMDCINCPRKISGGIYTAPNTATGISTLKVEG